MSDNNKWKKNMRQGWMDIVYMCVLILLFGYFCLFHETMELGDSFQYLNHQPMRDPVYSLFLQLLILVFGSHFEFALRLIQNILAVVCTYYAYKSITSNLKLPMMFRFATGMLLIVPHIITPLIAQSHLIMTNAILTEGIALSLYYVWFAWLIEIIVNVNGNPDTKFIRKRAIQSLLLALVLSMVRGQMIVCIIMWLIIVGYAYIVLKKYKSLAISIAAFLITFVFKSVFTGCYNYLENGFYTSTISTSPMMLANVVYVTQPEDLPVDESDEYLSCYRGIIEDSKAAGVLLYDGQTGLLDNALKHEQVHEEINFTYIENRTRELVYNQYGLDNNNYYAMRIELEKICKEMTTRFIPYVAGKYIHNYFSMVMLGLVRSVAVEKAGLWIYAILIYVIAVILTIVSLFRNRKCAAAYVMIAVIICIGGTVCGTCLAIQCISRYMMYNLPMFYIAGMALITSLRKGKE